VGRIIAGCTSLRDDGHHVAPGLNHSVIKLEWKRKPWAKQAPWVAAGRRFVRPFFSFIMILIALILPSCAFARLDVPSPPPRKPQPASESIAVPGSVTAPLLALKARFHLLRKQDVTTVLPLAPVVASIKTTNAPVTIRIDNTAQPLLTLTARGNGPGTLQIRIPQAHVEQADLRLVVENIEADAALREEETAIEALSLRLRLLDLPYWKLPVDLVAKAAVAAGTLNFSGTTTSAAGRVVATFEGIAHLREATGQAQFELRRIAFGPGGLQPNELVPALRDSLTAVRGGIAASGTARWSGGEPVISGTLSLRNLSFAAVGVDVENLSGAIALERIWPPRTPPGQALTVDRIDPGLEVTDGTVRFQIDDHGRLRIEQAGIAFSGGRLSVEPVTIDPGADHHDIVFRAVGLDLQEVLDTANVEAASASGSVSGRIPVSLSRRGIAVNRATLAADAHGFLRYQPAVPPDALQQEDGGVALLRDALKNFHYDRFSITLDGGSSQEWHSTVHLAGNNPDVLEGHPFVLNVNLTVVPGEALVELGAQSLNVGDTLPLYNALFGLGFLEWLGNRLAGIDTLIPNPAN
jgi:hypothetical protein